MPAILRGNVRSLHFTGETRALASNDGDGPASTLGRPRERRADPSERTTPARSPMLPPPSPHPYVGSLLGPQPRRVALPADDETAAGFYDNPTIALPRAELDVLPGLRPPKPPVAAPHPIPHFRPTAPGPVAAPPIPRIPRSATKTVRTRPTGAPLAVWIAGAAVVGLISFYVTPELVARPEARAVGAHHRYSARRWRDADTTSRQGVECQTRRAIIRRAMRAMERRSSATASMCTRGHDLSRPRSPSATPRR